MRRKTILFGILFILTVVFTSCKNDIYDPVKTNIVAEYKKYLGMNYQDAIKQLQNSGFLIVSSDGWFDAKTTSIRLIMYYTNDKIDIVEYEKTRYAYNNRQDMKKIATQVSEDINRFYSVDYPHPCVKRWCTLYTPQEELTPESHQEVISLLNDKIDRINRIGEDYGEIEDVIKVNSEDLFEPHRKWETTFASDENSHLWFTLSTRK
ncbi:MAG: hypothetical protein MJ010_02075 [Paludibacteraceae bacterium]|nr:hypothetical protein [Paludibacteraceae bacterium]